MIDSAISQAARIWGKCAKNAVVARVMNRRLLQSSKSKLVRTLETKVPKRGDKNIN